VKNEFVGVVFDAYVKDKMKSEDAFKELNFQERKVLELKQRIDGAAPYQFVAYPDFLPRRMLRSIAMSTYFTTFIYLVIFLNAITLAATHFNQPDNLTNLIDFADLIFAAVFAVEVILKLGGFGFRLYFREMGNTFDFVISTVCCFDSALVLLDQCTSRSSLRSFLRSMRVFRLLRLLNLFKGCEVIALTMNFAKAHLIAVFAILCVLILFFANISVVLFNEFPEISRFSSFRDETSAAQLLFVLMTGDDWTGTMGTMLDYDESMKGVVTVFFLTFMVTVTFIMVNLFIMVVCESFEVLSNETKKLVERSLPLFKEAWSFFDKNATGFAPEDNLEDLLKRIPEPFGVTFPPTYDEQVTTAQRQILHQKLAFVRNNLTLSNDGRMNFNEVMFLLVMYHTIETGELKSRTYVRSMMKLKAKLVIESELTAWVNRYRATRHEHQENASTVSKLARGKSLRVNAVAALETKEESKSLDCHEDPNLHPGSIEMTALLSKNYTPTDGKAAATTFEPPSKLDAAEGTVSTIGKGIAKEEVVPVDTIGAPVHHEAGEMSGVSTSSFVEKTHVGKDSSAMSTGATHGKRAAEPNAEKYDSENQSPSLQPKLKELSDVLLHHGLGECAAAFEEEEFDTALFMELIHDESDLEDMPTIEASSRETLVALARTLRNNPPLQGEFFPEGVQLPDVDNRDAEIPSLHDETDSLGALNSLPGVALPSQCVVRNYGDTSLAVCVSQNERWNWFFGWGSSASHMELGDPPCLSSEDFTVEVPSLGLGEMPPDGPPTNAWDAPQGYEWVRGSNWISVNQTKPPQAKRTHYEGSDAVGTKDLNAGDEGHQRWFYAPDVASLKVQSGSTTSESNSNIRRCVWMRPLQPKELPKPPPTAHQSNVAAAQAVKPRPLAVQELGSFLSSAGLGLLLKPLVDAGFDSVDVLTAACADSCSRDALERLGLKKLHIMKIQQTLEGTSSAPPLLPSYASTTSANIDVDASASGESLASKPANRVAL